MSCLNKPIIIGAALLVLSGMLVAPMAYATDAPTPAVATTQSAPASQRAPDITFPSGLALAVSPENLLLLTKNNQTIQLSYTQILALLSELVASQLMTQETSDKTKTLLNRLLNEQSDTLSSAEIMGLDKPLSLIKFHYKGPALQDPLNKSDAGLALDLSPHPLAEHQPVIKNEIPELESNVIRHDPAIEDHPKEAKQVITSIVIPEPLADENFNDSDIPDGSTDDWDTEIPAETGSNGEEASKTPSVAVAPAI